MLSVEQNGTFASSGLGDLHNEREHQGIDNKLMLSRVYTTSFTCKYNMEHYPFDMQVSIVLAQMFNLLSIVIPFSDLHHDICSTGVKSLDSTVNIFSTFILNFAG